MTKSLAVATYNLYLGADLSLVLGDRTEAELVTNLAEVQRQLLTTSFDLRVAQVADEIATHAPDLIGLQEVCTWILDETLLWDFGALLRAALADRGVGYDQVVAVDTFGGGALLPEGSGIPGRITLAGANVVLRRSDSPVRVTDTGAGLYGEALDVRTLDTDELAIVRGWCGAACEVDGAPFVFANTHTEAYAAGSRDQQRDELLAAAQRWAGPLVVVGDFNAQPEVVGMPPEFVDAWAVRGSGPGLTCCQAPDLTNEESVLHERIDYVWVRDAAVESAALLGVTPGPGPLRWPSDHAGVVARISLG